MLAEIQTVGEMVFLMGAITLMVILGTVAGYSNGYYKGHENGRNGM